MSTWLRNLRPRKPQSKPRLRSARPQVEALESREVPTVTYHGGAVLQNVEVQPFYYGSDWSNVSAYSAQRSQLDNYLQYLVQSSYTGVMLGNAYGTGPGSSSGDYSFQAALDKTQYLKDSTIRSTLQSSINKGLLQQPDANRLYVVFVEPGVTILNDNFNNETSAKDFAGYHMAFGGTDYWGHAADIHYAVISYQSTYGLTMTVSHELAEAITDPNVNYKTKGWYDDNLNGEIGDVCAWSTAYLAGYAVQRVVDRNDQPMTPYSAGLSRPVQFVLQGGGYLYEYSSSGRTFINSGVTSVSDQGSDLNGNAMVDYVTSGGYAYEFHDMGGSVRLPYTHVVQAKAGQGVSYVMLYDPLFNNNRVYEYSDPGTQYPAGKSSGPYGGTGNGVQSIDAGTDKYGVNAVDMVLVGGDAWMHSDTDGWHHLMSGVSQLSGGQQGLAALLDQSGNVWYYNEWSGTPTWLDWGARQVTTGYDAWGHLTVGVVFNDASAWIYTPSYNSWGFLTGGVQQMSKDNLGVVSVLFGGTDTSYFDVNGWHSLLSSGGVAVA